MAVEEFNAESRRVVVRRLQAGAWLVLAGSVLLLLNDLLLHRGELWTLWAPKLVLLVVTLATGWALRQPFPLPVLRWIGAGLITTTYFATAVASARLGDVARTPVIAIVIVMATTYIPFGLGPHVVSLLGAWLAISLNLWLVHSAGGSLAAFGYSGVAFLAATIASIYGAYELQRSFVERRNAARSMLARSHAEREARVALALSQAAAELNASLETSAIAERLTATVRRLLEADAVAVLLCDDPGEDLAVVVASGAAQGRGPRSHRAYSIPGNIVSPPRGSWCCRARSSHTCCRRSPAARRRGSSPCRREVPWAASSSPAHAARRTAARSASSRTASGRSPRPRSPTRACSRSCSARAA
jgi:hypothetical protein